MFSNGSEEVVIYVFLLLHLFNWERDVTTKAPTSNMVPFSTGRVFAGVKTKGYIKYLKSKV